MAKVKASSEDVHIGERIKRARILRTHSQEKLAEFIGVTPQQVQKYERGTNRVSSATLYKISSSLEMPITYFYKDLDQPDYPDQPFEITKPVAELLNLYNKMPPQRQKDLLKILKAFV